MSSLDSMQLHPSHDMLAIGVFVGATWSRAMALTDQQRECVIRSAVQILKHRKRDRLLEILAQRLANDDYEDEAERELDRIAHALACAVKDELAGGERG